MDYTATESFIDWCDDMYIAEEGVGDLLHKAFEAFKRLVRRIKTWIKSLFHKSKDKKIQSDLKESYEKVEKVEAEVVNNPDVSQSDIDKGFEVLKQQEKEVEKAAQQMEETKNDALNSINERHKQFNKILKNIDNINENTKEASDMHDEIRKNLDELDKMLNRL
jgi:methyl-accepting chemotaxis protein